MNRIQAWGVNSALGLVFKSLLEELVQEDITPYTQHFFSAGCIDDNKVTISPGLNLENKLELVFGQALNQFLQLVQNGLDNAGCDDDEIEQYLNPFGAFIRHHTVLSELGKPFFQVNLDSDKFVATWQDLNLHPLPSDFDWQEILNLYFRRVKSIIQESDLVALFQLNHSETLEPNLYLLRYRQAIIKKYGNLRLDTLDTEGYKYQIELWKMFVAQNVREVEQILPQIHELPKEVLDELKATGQIDEKNLDVSPDILEQLQQAYINQQIRSVVDIINDEKTYQHTVILGDPGSGKSSLVQYAALEWTNHPIESLASWSIPFLIELRLYAQAKEAQGIESFIEFCLNFKVSDDNNIFTINQLEALLESGKAYFMFDGLDEVFDPRQRKKIVKEIIDFSSQYDLVRVLVTSRVIGYDPQSLREHNFRHFMLQDLEDEQITDFINRWHDLAFGNNVDKVRKKERLQAAINNYSPIRQLAGNPLLLTMMAILNRNQELPKDRAELYHQASRVLLQNWDVEKALKDNLTSIDYKDKQAILRQVAQYMQTNKSGFAGNLISAKDLARILTNYLLQIKINQPDKVAKAIINQLRERNFILCFVGADYYAFVHRTFLEYFCAWEYVWQFEKTRQMSFEKIKSKVFGKYWRDESWHEVLCLIAGMIDAEVTSDLIKYLLFLGLNKQDFFNIFLAAKFFIEVKNKNEILPTANILLKQLQALTEFYDIEIRTQAIIVIVTTFKDYPNTKAFLKKCIEEYKYWDVRKAAVQELARVFKDDPDTLSILKNLATTDNSGYVRRAAVEALAWNFPQDPETLTMLKHLATNDNDQNVRRAALTGLVWNFLQDPETLTMLKHLATNDNDKDIRRGVVTGLAWNFPQDPETLNILKHRARNDSDKDVRSAALTALANNFTQAPDTLTVLRHLARKDNDKDVRLAAIKALARNFTQDPDNVSLLKHLAKTDNYEDVRLTAMQVLNRYFKEE